MNSAGEREERVGNEREKLRVMLMKNQFIKNVKEEQKKLRINVISTIIIVNRCSTLWLNLFNFSPFYLSTR